jgi:HEAT repeat protein
MHVQAARASVRHGFLLAGGLVAGLVGCGGVSDCKEDGALCAEMLNKNAEKCAFSYQLRQSEDQRQHCENAVKVVGNQKIKAAIPGLVAILKTPESSTPDDKHRLEAAKALGRIGDPSVVDALLEALDLTVGTSSDPKDKAGNRSNEEICQTLGMLGEKKAVPKLVEAMQKSRDDYVVLKAVRSLGQLKDPGAVAPLSKVALEHNNKFMRKNAVQALGELGELSATDVLVRMMFIEYQGVSFYKEASFALYQLGPGVADKLLETMSGNNKEVNADFEKTGGVKESAIKAKCGFVLGDLRDKRAVDPLIEAFKGATQPDKLDPVVIAFSAAPLGALGDAKAVPVLKAEMGTLDASLRDPIMRALNQLGDRSVVPDMITAMTKDSFVAKCVKDTGSSKEDCGSDETAAALHAAQQAAADNASNLAGAEHLEAFKKAVDAEQAPKVKAYFEARLKRVQAAGECKLDAACWAKKLDDAEPVVREKAAWELSRIKDASTIDRLAKALTDTKPEARSAAIMAYWAYGDERAIPAIEKQLEDESSSADFVRVNEDLKRMLVHLKRLKKS